MKRLSQLLNALIVAVASPLAAADVKVAVIRVDYEQLAPISRFEERAQDYVFAGGALATEDNSTTGQFLGHTFETVYVEATPETALESLNAARDSGASIFALHARKAEALALADAAPDALFLNIGAGDTQLRSAECRANTLHISPSHAMRADAVAQYLVWKKWDEVLLVKGSNSADIALAEAYDRAITRFGLTLREEREIRDTGGSRRSDTGHVLVQRQLPVLLQGAKRHDAVIAADGSDVFAPYLPYHLWDPRPVLGSAGLRPVSFNAATESWGGTQFHTRFERLSKRYVTEADYDAWVALRAIGEAVTRTNSNDPAALRAFLLSDAFELAAFRGQPLTFRSWNGQLRQPIMLFDGRINASVSPQEGFLHPLSPLDTLGLDQPDSACTAFE